MFEGRLGAVPSGDAGYPRAGVRALATQVEPLREVGLD